MNVLQCEACVMHAPSSFGGLFARQPWKWTFDKVATYTQTFSSCLLSSLSLSSYLVNLNISVFTSCLLYLEFHFKDSFLKFVGVFLLSFLLCDLPHPYWFHLCANVPTCDSLMPHASLWPLNNQWLLGKNVFSLISWQMVDEDYCQSPSEINHKKVYITAPNNYLWLRWLLADCQSHLQIYARRWPLRKHSP